MSKPIIEVKDYSYRYASRVRRIRSDTGQSD